jgi:hypothetical protein
MKKKHLNVKRKYTTLRKRVVPKKAKIRKPEKILQTARKRKRGGNPGNRKSLHERRGNKRGSANGGLSGGKGKSGNPFGRPTNKCSIAEILREIGNITIKEFTLQFGTFKNISLKHALHLSAYEAAVYGQEPWAVEYIAERTEGKVTQPIGLPDEVIHVRIEK